MVRIRARYSHSYFQQIYTLPVASMKKGMDALDSHTRDSLKIVMIRTNPIVSDPRVFKEAQSLSSLGHVKITILAWDRGAEYKATEKLGRATIRRMRFKASYSNLFSVAYLPIFWFWVILQLCIRHPDIVHSFDIDTIIPAYIYRKLVRRSKIIFDVCDRFSDSSFFSRPATRPFRVFLAFFEDVFACKTDALIVVSQRQLRSFRRARFRKAHVIMNCPPQGLVQKGTRTKEANLFRVVHAGTLREDYGILELVTALESIGDVEAIFAGRVTDRKIIERISKSPKIQFLGELPYEEALTLEASADVIPILCDPKRPATIQALPNRLFEAMMLGIPVIVNDELKSSVEIVSATGCGLVVKYDPISIEKAILYLKENSEARIEMGSRGRKAFAEKYNWSKMEERLLNVYYQLISKDSY